MGIWLFVDLVICGFGDGPELGIDMRVKSVRECSENSVIPWSRPLNPLDRQLEQDEIPSPGKPNPQIHKSTNTQFYIT
jgi:hypothetical protein